MKVTLPLLTSVLTEGTTVDAQVRIKDLCKVKGQETITLRGVGLVVGLAGTGDPNLEATKRALARSLSGSGLEMPLNASGQELVEGLKGTPNAALVFITAEVPGAGVRQGSVVNCRVDSFGSATSLQGGRLIEAAMTAGPYAGESGKLEIWATASGSTP